MGKGSECPLALWINYCKWHEKGSCDFIQVKEQRYNNSPKLVQVAQICFDLETECDIKKGCKWFEPKIVTCDMIELMTGLHPWEWVHWAMVYPSLFPLWKSLLKNVCSWECLHCCCNVKKMNLEKYVAWNYKRCMILKFSS